MSYFEKLYAPWRFKQRVAAKSIVGVVNTGIDVANLFRDLDDQFKPIDLDKDVFAQRNRAVANTIGDLTNPNRGAQAQDILKSMTRAPESAIGEFSEDSAVFLTGFLGGRKLIQGAIGGAAKAAQLGRAGKIAVDTAAGAVSAFTLEDPHGDRLVNFIPEHLRPEFIDYLAYDPSVDESRIEGRLKNAMVDMGLGVLADGAFELIAKSFRHARRGIHLDAAGDPEMAAKLAADRLGAEAVPPALPRSVPDIDLSSQTFESLEAPVSAKGAISVADEVEAVEAIIRMGPAAEEDAISHLVRSMNITHFALDNPDQVVDMTEKIIGVIGRQMDNQGTQTWGEVAEMSDDLAGKTKLDAFEALAKLTDDVATDVEKATPAAFLIKRLFVESAETMNALVTKYHKASPKGQKKFLKELRLRGQTHMILTGGLSRLASAGGRFLNSFKMRVEGDLGAFSTAVTRLVDEKIAEGAKKLPRGSKGSPKPRKPRTGPQAPKVPEGSKNVLKQAKDQLASLTKQLDTLRSRFGDDGKIPDSKRSKPDPDDIKDLKDRIKFFKGAEADARKLEKLEGKLEALTALNKRGTQLDLAAGVGDLKIPKGPKGPQETKLLEKISKLRKTMQDKLDKLEGNSLEDRVADILADRTPQSLERAMKESSDELFQGLMDAMKHVDMADARAWVAHQQAETGIALKFMQAFRQIKMMNILSGIPTFVMNNTGNTLSIGFRAGFEDIIASMVPSRAPDRMTLMSEMRGLRAMVEQPAQIASDLFNATAESFRTGEALAETMGKLAVDNITILQAEQLAVGTLINSNATGARLINSLGRVAHVLSFGHMTFTDAGYKQLAFAKEAVAIGWAKGTMKGLKGRELVEYADTMTKQAIFLARKSRKGGQHMMQDMKAKGMSIDDAVRHLTEVSDMVNSARQYAKEGTFQDAISSETLKWVENGLNKNNAGTHLFKTLVVPFFRTPVKIVEFAWERTPVLNLTSRKLRADLKGINGARQQQRAVAKFITGATMYTGAFQLAQNSLITGKHRPEERAALLADGIPEYSIRAPHTDKWISFNRADPFAMFLGISADLNKLVEAEELDGGTAAAAVINALSSNVLNKTFMKGLSDSLKAANSPAEFGAYYTDSQVRAIVSPLGSFQRSFEKVWNANSEEYRKQKPEPAFTELRDWTDILIGDSGLTSTREYDMSDALGNKIERGPLWSELTGLRSVETDSSPSMRQLALHKRFPSNRELSLASGFKMNRTEFLDFKEILGSPKVNLRGRMDKLVGTRAYRRASADKQAQMLDKIIAQGRKLAKASMLKKDPELKARVVKHEREKLLRALRTSEQSTGIASIEDILTTRRQTFEREE